MLNLNNSFCISCKENQKWRRCCKCYYFHLALQTAACVAQAIYETAERVSKHKLLFYYAYSIVSIQETIVSFFRSDRLTTVLTNINEVNEESEDLPITEQGNSDQIQIAMTQPTQHVETTIHKQAPHQLDATPSCSYVTSRKKRKSELEQQFVEVGECLKKRLMSNNDCNTPSAEALFGKMVGEELINITNTVKRSQAKIKILQVLHDANFEE